MSFEGICFLIEHNCFVDDPKLKPSCVRCPLKYQVDNDVDLNLDQKVEFWTIVSRAQELTGGRKFDMDCYAKVEGSSFAFTSVFPFLRICEGISPSISERSDEMAPTSTFEIASKF